MTDLGYVAQDGQDRSAHEIFQAHLDVSTRLVFLREGAAYCAHAMLPFVYRTKDGETIIETEADLIADIEWVNDFLRTQGVTDYHRIARRARFVAPDIIEGFHVTYALRGAVPVVEPYANRMILRNVAGHWRTSYAEHELAEPLHDKRLARPAPGLFAPFWQGDSPAQADILTEALPIYQAFLDDNGAHLNAGDFEAWADDFTLPHQVHFEATDIIVHDHVEKRPFFDSIREKMAERGANTLVRRAGYAAFVSPTRIFGYHEAHFTRGGETRFGPIKSRKILTLTDAGWKCADVTNGLTNTHMAGGVFEPTDSLPTFREIQERTRK